MSCSNKPARIARGPVITVAGRARRIAALFVACCCASLLLGLPARATVLLNLTLDELVGQSLLIVEAEVLASQVVSEGDQIRTRLTLAISEILKGAARNDTLTLDFLGGAIDDRTLEVSGQFIPRTGSRGYFFINDPLGEQVNPLTGWYQGFFPVTVTPAGEAMLNLDARPDLVLANTADDPRVQKMLALGMSEQQILARFPEYQLFTAADFEAAIAAIIQEQGD
jgi:hypothetical protein